MFIFLRYFVWYCSPRSAYSMIHFKMVGLGIIKFCWGCNIWMRLWNTQLHLSSDEDPVVFSGSYWLICCISQVLIPHRLREHSSSPLLVTRLHALQRFPWSLCYSKGQRWPEWVSSWCLETGFRIHLEFWQEPDDPIDCCYFRKLTRSHSQGPRKPSADSTRL